MAWPGMASSHDSPHARNSFIIEADFIGGRIRGPARSLMQAPATPFTPQRRFFVEAASAAGFWRIADHGRKARG
jgi:hypothetical protein